MIRHIPIAFKASIHNDRAIQLSKVPLVLKILNAFKSNESSDGRSPDGTEKVLETVEMSSIHSSGCSSAQYVYFRSLRMCGDR